MGSAQRRQPTEPGTQHHAVQVREQLGEHEALLWPQKLPQRLFEFWALRT
jgi:hypothetical protein